MPVESGFASEAAAAPIAARSTTRSQPARARGRRGVIGALPRVSMLFAMLFGSLWIADEAAAQYTFGRRSVAPGHDLVSAEELRQKGQDAPWAVGGLRIQPVAGLDDVSYVRDQTTSGIDGLGTEEAEDDFTATVSAGVRAYASAGTKLVWAAHVLPEYVWWQDNDDRGGFGGRGGLGAFGEFNRLRFEVSHRVEQRQRFFSTEVQVLTQQETQVTRARAEVRAARRLWLFAGAEQTRLEGDEDAALLFSRLDRDTDSWDAGVRLESPRGIEAWLGVGSDSVDFAEGSRNLSNEEDRILAGLSYERDRLGIWLAGEARDASPSAGSLFPESSTTTGDFELLWRASSRFDTLLFARSDRTYSLQDAAAFIDTTYVGVGAEWSLGQSRARLWTSSGEDDYEGIEGVSLSRTDDFVEVGAGLDASLGRLLIVGIDLYYRDYDSSNDLFDRDVTNLGVRVQLGSISERLRLGGGPGLW